MGLVTLEIVVNDYVTSEARRQLHNADMVRAQSATIRLLLFI